MRMKAAGKQAIVSLPHYCTVITYNSNWHFAAVQKLFVEEIINNLINEVVVIYSDIMDQ